MSPRVFCWVLWFSPPSTKTRKQWTDEPLSGFPLNSHFLFICFFHSLSFTALGTEGLETVERPRERRRRNSDSDFHCKTRYDEIGESKKESEISPGEEAKYLDSEKLAFVQNYLQNIPETHSMTTETSDSGIRTLGEPSNIEMQDITCKYHLLFGLMDISQSFIERVVNNR